MTREQLFWAIGQVEESRLAQTEASVDASPNLGKEDFSMKNHTNPRRIARNFLIAAVIVSLLAVTAFATTTFLLYESPSQMVAALFGNNTGYDHKGITTWSDPQKPGSLYTNPGYDRVEADPTVVQEDIAPHISPVGQSASWEGYTLTVDSVLYDSHSRCGFVTYLLENPQGIRGYGVFENGKLNENDLPLRSSLYGYPYILQEKTTDTRLAVTFYFRNLHKDENLVLSFPITEEPRTDAEIQAIMDTLDAQLRKDYTPEEAVAKAIEKLGRAQFLDYCGELDEVDSAYSYLRFCLYQAEYTQRGASVTIPLGDTALTHATAGNGSVVVTPLCIQVDVTDLEFLHRQEADGAYISGDNVKTVELRFADGSSYQVRNDTTDNTIFAIISSASDGEQDTGNLLTLMFNRVIPVKEVAAVILNGTALKMD